MAERRLLVGEDVRISAVYQGLEGCRDEFFCLESDDDVSLLAVSAVNFILELPALEWLLLLLVPDLYRSIIGSCENSLELIGIYQDNLAYTRLVIAEGSYQLRVRVENLKPVLDS